MEYTVRTLTATVFEVPENPEKDFGCSYNKLELREYLAKSKEVEKKNTCRNNNQVVYNIYLSHCTPEMETKPQGMETWGKIDQKKYGLGLISLICYVAHRRDETSQAMLDILRADKELMICLQHEHISLTQYLTESKTRT